MTVRAGRSVGKMLATQVWGIDFSPQKQWRKADLVHTCKLSTGEREAGHCCSPRLVSLQKQDEPLPRSMLRLTSDLNTQAPVGLQIDLWLVRSVLAVQSCNFRCQLAHIYLCPGSSWRLVRIGSSWGRCGSSGRGGESIEVPPQGNGKKI